MSEQKYTLAQMSSLGTKEGSLVKDWYTYSLAQNRYGNYGSNVNSETYFYDEALIRKIDLITLASEKKWQIFSKYTPPTTALTLDDFVTYFTELFNSNSPSYYYYNTCWEAEALAKRSTGGSRNHYLTSVLEHQFKNKFGLSFKYAQKINYLNEFIASKFDGTFDEFIESGITDPNIQKRIDEYVFHNYSHLDDLLRFADNRGPGSFGQNSLKKTRTILFDLNRETWSNIIVDSVKYRGGRTHEHTVKLLDQIDRKLHPENYDKEYRRTPEDTRRDFITHLANKAAQESGLAPKHFNTIVSAGMQVVPTAYRITANQDLYDEVIGLIPENTSLKDIVGVFAGLTQPNLWIRGVNQNYLFTFKELMSSDCPGAFVSLISELVYEGKGMMPTVTEWKKSTALLDDALPLDWFLTIAISTTAKKESRKIEDAIIPLRNLNK